MKASRRHALPSRDFAVPENEGLPIDTEGRIRSAMGRFNQYVFDSLAQAKRAYQRIVTRARAHGVDPTNFANKYRNVRLTQRGLARAANNGAIVRNPSSVVLKKWGSPDRVVVAKQHADREWYYLDGSPVEVGGVYVDELLGPAEMKPPGVRNPVGDTELGMLHDWMRKEYYRRWTTSPDRSLIGDASMALQADPDRLNATQLRKVVAALKRSLKAGKHAVREYGYIPREKEAIAELEELIDAWGYEAKHGRKNPSAVKPPGVRNAHPGEMAPDDFVEGVAKAFWVTMYADEVEEAGLSDELGPGAGGDWMDVLPEIPEAAYEDAHEFIQQLRPVRDIIKDAEAAEGNWIDIEELGYYLAMPAMGHGVHWFDDHAEFDIDIPYFDPVRTRDAAMEEVA